MNNLCDCCSVNPIRRYKSDKIVWCAQCVKENTNLLNSLDLDDGWTGEHRTPDNTITQYAWSIKSNVEKLIRFCREGVKIGE